jgi:sulfate adenylyltransferase subunit 1 (EFTu-like GTPase family)
LHTTSPLFFDDYHQNRTTGSLILIDEASGQTAAAGMLLSPRS